MRTVRSPTPRLILHLLHLYWCTCAFARSAYRIRVGGNAGICSDIGSCCRKRWMVAAQSGALRRYLQHSSCAGTTCDVTADHQPPPGRIPAWSLKSFFAPSFSRAAQCRRRCDTLRHTKPARSRMPRIWRQAILPGEGPPVGPPKRSLPLVLVQPHPCIPSVRRNLPDAYRPAGRVWEPNQIRGKGFRGLCEDRSLSARSPRWRRLPSGLLSFGAHAVGAVYTTSHSKWFEGLRGAAVPLLTVGKASAISVGRLRNLVQNVQWRTVCYPAPQPCASHLSKHCSLFPRTRRNAQSQAPHDIKWNFLRHRH